MKTIAINRHFREVLGESMTLLELASILAFGLGATAAPVLAAPATFAGALLAAGVIWIVLWSGLSPMMKAVSLMFVLEFAFAFPGDHFARASSS